MSRQNMWSSAMALVSILAASLNAEEPTPPPPSPKKPPIAKTTASLDKSGNLLVNVRVYVPVQEIRLVKKDNREIRVAVTRQVAEARTIRIAKGRFVVFDAKGKRVGPMALPQLLKTKKVVLVAGNGMAPLEKMKKVDGDTLVVVKLAKQKTR